MAKFTASVPLNMRWFGNEISGAAGATHRIGDEYADEFAAGPGAHIPGFAWVTQDEASAFLPLAGGVVTGAATVAGAFVAQTSVSTPSLTATNARFKGEPWFDVKAYGAVGDGVTNDSAAIQAAIDAANTAGGGTVFLPSGSYKANITLKSGVTLRGASDVHGYNGINISRIIQQSATTAIIDTPDTQSFGIAVVNIVVLGLGSAVAGRGIYFRNVRWSKIVNCFVDNTADEGIALGSSSVACTVEDILITNAIMNRTRSATIGAIDVDGTDHFISRVEATPSLSALTSANLYLCAIVLRGGSHFISDSVGEVADVGLRDLGSYSRITGVRADINFGHGFMLGGYATYVGCMALNNSQGNSNVYSGFYAPVSTAQTNVMSGCISISTISVVHKYGFEDYGSYADPNARNSGAGLMSYGHGTGIFRTATPTTLDSDSLVFYPFNIVDVTGTGTKSMQSGDAGLGHTTPRVSMPLPGSIVGVFLAVDSGRTSGTLTATVNVDAVSQASPTAVIDGSATFRKATNIAKGTTTVTAGQTIGLDLVGASFAPTTNIVMAGIWVLHSAQ